MIRDHVIIFHHGHVASAVQYVCEANDVQLPRPCPSWESEAGSWKLETLQYTDLLIQRKIGWLAPLITARLPSDFDSADLPDSVCMESRRKHSKFCSRTRARTSHMSYL